MGPTHLGDEEEPQEVEGGAEHTQEYHLPSPLPQGWELIHDGGGDGLDVPKLRDRDVRGVAETPPPPGWSPPCPHGTEHTLPVPRASGRWLHLYPMGTSPPGAHSCLSSLGAPQAWGRGCAPPQQQPHTQSPQPHVPCTFCLLHAEVRVYLAPQGQAQGRMWGFPV